MSIYIGEPKQVTDYSAMQGPCDKGFHIPKSQEWVNVRTIGNDLGLWTKNNGSNVRIYLKIPFAGYRNHRSSGNLSDQTLGYYWCCDNYPGVDSVGLYCALYDSRFQCGSDRSYEKEAGMSIRAFKDVSVTPNSSWTALYQGSGSSGIFHNPTLGLISLSSDGTNWITIQDKNVGATTIYNNGDSFSEANSGKLFQWGNNYGFSYSGSISTSTNRVSTSGYGPGNYYSSSTFIYSTSNPRDWSSPSNNNLWGAVTGTTQKSVSKLNNIYLGEGKTIVLSDMQGPCPDGFHVPLSSEWTGLKTIMDGLSLTTGADYVQKLHIPIAGNRQNNSTADVYNVGTLGYYWCSTPNSGNSDYFIIGDDSSGASVGSSRRCFGFTIRPFKNEFVIPDSSWTVVQGTLGGAGIFWNQTGGLISITSNGTTGYTIADKNLGATTVYTRGDTRSESNCGKYYQWGNNYGFPFSGSVTTSDTRVSTSIYGPGNYYNSSTFIYYRSGDRDWSNPANDNLRGGTSQGSSTVIKPGIKEVYKGTNKVYPIE